MKLSQTLGMYAIAAMSLLSPSQAKASLTGSPTDDNDNKPRKGWAIGVQARSGVVFSRLPSFGYKETAQENKVRIDYMGTTKGGLSIGPYIGARFLMQYHDYKYNYRTPTTFSRGTNRTTQIISLDYETGVRVQQRLGEGSHIYIDPHYQQSLSGSVPRGRPGSTQPTRPLSRSGFGVTAGASLRIFRVNMGSLENKKMVDVKVYGEFGVRETKEADLRGRITRGRATEMRAGVIVYLPLKY